MHYHCRDGMHTLTPEDWTQYMDFADFRGWTSKDDPAFDGGLLKGLWELPTVGAAADVTQVFSHFKLEQKNFKVTRSDAEFKDPKKVPLTTATRKALAVGGV